MPGTLIYVVGAVAAILATLALVLGPRRAWAVWQRYGHAIGDVLARVVLTVFYFTIFAPFAAIARLTQDPLALQPDNGPLWHPLAVHEPGLDAARRQY